VSKSSPSPARPWRVIAEELSLANRGDRILELAEELERALEEQMPGARKSVAAVSPGAADNSGDPHNNPQQRRQS
jgi:hypothetical protein